MSGLPEWCSALALVDGDELLLGAVYQATTDELWLGGPGIPTTLNGAPVRRAGRRGAARDLDLDLPAPGPAVPAGAHRTRCCAASRGSAALRVIGSGSVELAAIAGARLGVWVHADTLSWDWFPGAALVQGVGGATDVFEADGIRWHLAGPATAVAEVKALLLA